MDTMDFYPVQLSTAPLVPQRLELAPEGWREFVQYAAHGDTFMRDGAVYCKDCERELHQGRGHDVMCLTIRARLMLDEESRLHASRTQEALAHMLFLQEADIDKVHANRPPVDVMQLSHPVARNPAPPPARQRSSDEGLKRPWQTAGHGHYEYIQTVCDAYESGMGDALASKSPQNPYRYSDDPDRRAAYKAGFAAGAQLATDFADAADSTFPAEEADPRREYLAARTTVVKLMHSKGMSDKAIADVLATTVDQVRLIRTSHLDDPALAPEVAAQADAVAQSQDDSRDARWYRLLRDAKKLPAEVWAALEFGEGLDQAMDRFDMLRKPIPLCPSCKAGRYAECECAIPCALPADDADV
ncbi:hypothetical protein [Massilia sp. Leaf139]|uniref:hypothetical protein n=1 Tax=Massilia sp. Leaf139 TaxID=1736272 RepID=UPI0006FF8225|nr:hypothetical protein [Massilia sp. Leaf139]KQQ96126.1 hypothetical protein ASF77_21720 [Massilia sp. Leaf139]